MSVGLTEITGRIRNHFCDNREFIQKSPRLLPTMQAQNLWLNGASNQSAQKIKKILFLRPKFVSLKIRSSFEFRNKNNFMHRFENCDIPGS